MVPYWSIGDMFGHAPHPVAAVPMKGRCEYRVIPILDSDCVFVYFQPTTTVRGWWRDFLVQVPFGFCLFFRSPVPPVPGSDPRSPRDQAVGEFWVNRVISGQHSSLVLAAAADEIQLWFPPSKLRGAAGITEPASLCR